MNNLIQTSTLLSVALSLSIFSSNISAKTYDLVQLDSLGEGFNQVLSQGKTTKGLYHVSTRESASGMGDMETSGHYASLYGMSTHGKILGSALGKASVFDSHNVMQDLNSFLWSSRLDDRALVSVVNINDKGDINNHMENRDQAASEEAFLFTLSAVPEPAMVWLFTPALIGLVIMRRQVEKAKTL